MKPKKLLQQLMFFLLIFNVQDILLQNGANLLHAQTHRYVATSGSNSSNDCTSPGSPCATIAHALNESTSGDIINIAAGAYTQSQSGGLLIQKSITLIGAGRNNTFVQAHANPSQAGHRTITIAPLPIDVEISALTLRNGVAMGSGIAGRGGGIYYDFDSNNPGSLTIDDVKFQQNAARVGGGIFNSSGSAPVFETVHFQDNSATERGGGMYNWTDSAPEVINSVFQNNNAGISGGGIYNTAVSLLLDQSTFSGNFASLGCGAMVLQNNSTATVTASSFTTNTASGNGAALCVDGGSFADISGTLFENNEAFGGSGGAVHIVNSSPEFNDVTFTSNVAGGNQNGDGGGAVYIGVNSMPLFQNSEFNQNTSSYNGGAVACYSGAEPEFINVDFVENDAVLWGGGMANLDGSSPILENVVFQLNSASGQGGGMVNSNSSLPNLTGVNFIGNTAGAGGGMANNGNCSPQMANVIFIGNTGHEGGGGMYNLNNSNPEVVNGIFAQNFAVDPNLGHGAGMYNEDSSPTIMNATFSKNQASGVNSAGGGMANYGTAAPVVFNTILWNNIAADGNEIFNNTAASASLHFSLYANGTDDIVQGAGFTCSDCLTDDPLFVDPASNFFQLTQSSPAIDAGDPNTAVMSFPVDGNSNPIDILGNPRFMGSAIDIGAFEWNANLSIATISENTMEIVIYPNPAQEVVYIKAPHIIEQLLLHDLLGKTLLPERFKGLGTTLAKVDVSDLEKGIYLINVTANGQTGTYKIIKR